MIHLYPVISKVLLRQGKEDKGIICHKKMVSKQFEIVIKQV